MSQHARAHRQRFRIAPATRVAMLKAFRVGMQGLKAELPERLGDWAVDNFKLSGDSSHQKGDWQAWPFQIGWMDAFSNDDIEEVNVQKAKRVGYTKTLVAYVCQMVAQRRRSLALWQPTDDDRDSFVKTEIEPAMAQVKAMRAAQRRTKGTEDSIKLKSFLGCLAHFLGGKAARAYRRITVAAALLDEIDGFDQRIEKSSDPVTLARGRLEGAPYPKLIVGSTPRLKDLSHIERRVKAASARLRYRIECPHCSAEHPLMWGGPKARHGFKWEADAPMPAATAHHVCPHCEGKITQADYLRLWAQGAWVCDITGIRYGADRTWRNDRSEPIRPPKHVAFVGVWTAYSPQRTWQDIAREAIEAEVAKQAGDSGPMIGFVNETLAETWEEEFEQSDGDALERRAKAEKLPLGVVPRGAAVLKQAFDVQGDRWERAVYAFGPEGESWCIDYQVVYGNTADPKEWDAKVEPLLSISYPTATGMRLTVGHTAIDTGYQTHIAYAFCRKHKARGAVAVKGDTQPGKAIKSKRSLVDINTKGRVIRKGIALWFVGTDTAKDLIHGRLQLEGSGPGRMHFAAGLPSMFFPGLTAEQRVPVRTTRGLEFRWDCPSGRRNEPLDCTVYCLFLAELDDLPRWTSAQWTRALQALEPDLFSMPAVPADAEPAQQPAAQPAAGPKRPLPPRAAAPIGSDEWNSRL